MHEVHLGAVDLGEEVRERVQPLLGPAPVVGATPIVDELGQIPELRSVVPIRIGELFRQPRTRQPFAKIDQVRLGNVDGEGFDVDRHTSTLSRARMPRARLGFDRDRRTAFERTDHEIAGGVALEERAARDRL